MSLSCEKCPVCGHFPRWHWSMIKDVESIGCYWEKHCPQDGSFDFVTDYLPVDKAVSEWNSAVAAYNAR